MRPVVVGVSLRVMVADPPGEPCDRISHEWIRYLDHRGISPVLIPNVLREPVAFAERSGVRALLLTSGGDVSSRAGAVAPADGGARLERLRDATEWQLLEWAMKRRTPVLGVCRGMQALNVYFGGRLVRDLQEAGLPSLAHVGRRHRVRVVESGEAVMTNSFHHHAVTTSTLSAELQPLAVADGEIVEAFSHRRLPVLGIQWHPERPGSATRLDRLLLDRWLGRRLQPRPPAKRYAQVGAR